ncbi:protein spinster homolog 3 [Boleophthalmus pectinirostris]|uniref:protein spinster homolog 3 n=1 Tax=Boleophthalmus pectinirostris TaxID=150288 RepID=UPI00242E0501|nr:protein spinster homolog 3 [Boleophthalmus pectinirostris]
MEPRISVSSFREVVSPRRSLSASFRYGSFVESTGSLDRVGSSPVSPARGYVAVAVLCYINLLNYMERYTLAGVLLNIQTFFNINDSTAGLLQTVFICSFLLFAPLFGYLGDRYNRKYIMMCGLLVWLITALCSSFVTQNLFWFLMLMRGLVGVGEASYSTIAPTIIGDLFTGTKRSSMISIFYIFIPVGSGLGYISGASIASATGDWRWALRLTPILGVIGLLLLGFLCPNPSRGAVENQGQTNAEPTSYKEDIKYLLKNKSFVWSTLAVTAMAFLTGALAFWMPLFLSRAQVFQGILQPCTMEPCSSKDSYIFGGITVVTGILGVCIGASLSRCFLDKVQYADPVICAVGMLGSVPFLFATIFTASVNIIATYVFIFISEVLLSLCWPILADIILYVVVPTRRASAEALQITVLHLLGDAGSPYLIGTISDAIHNSKLVSVEWSFLSLKYGLLLCPLAGVLGGVFFLITACYITKDRNAALQMGQDKSSFPPDPSTTSVELQTGKN